MTQATTDLQKLNDRLTYAAATHSETVRHLHTAGVHVAASDPLAVALTALNKAAEAIDESINQMQSHLTHRITYGKES